MTPSEEIVGRYAKVEREVDVRGRVIGVRRVKLSQQLKVEEWYPALDGVSESVDADGAAVSIPRRAIPIIAAAVCEVDGSPIPFARSRGELDAVIDMLDAEGIAAAAKAFSTLNPKAEDTGSAVDQAKK